MVNEEIVKKRSDFGLGLEAWSSGFEVAVSGVSGVILLYMVRKSLFVQR